MQPTETKTEKMLVRQTKFDLEAFDDVYLGKYVDKPVVTSMADALATVGGDHNALLDVVRTGLIERAREEAKKNQEGWFFMADNNPNELTDKPFSGTLVDPKGVRQTVITLAKTIYGYVSGRGLSDAQKAKNESAKEKAEELVKNTPDIREGLVKAAQEQVEE